MNALRVVAHIVAFVALLSFGVSSIVLAATAWVYWGDRRRDWRDARTVDPKLEEVRRLEAMWAHPSYVDPDSCDPHGLRRPPVERPEHPT